MIFDIVPHFFDFVPEETLEKLGYAADCEGRSVNSHVLVLIRVPTAYFR